MPRLFAPLLALALLLPLTAAQASYITRTLDKPVPGGVAVVNLGPAASAPSARFDGKPVLVVVVALICLVGVLPYIALQLKGIVLGV
ncbi:MAG: hypothetical protein H5U33_05325, partial [Pseudomonas sp.]|nr:hypothetical protein [Pseudomonas sp.]